MTDANQGSVDTGNPAGSEVNTAANAENGSGKSGDWWGGLQDEGNRALVEAKGWTGKGLDDAFKSYRELESRLGKAIVPPKEDASPEDWSAFYGKVGRPEKADGYQFKMPEGLPENLPYDAKSAEDFKSWAHEAGLNPKQAQTLHDQFVRMTANQVQAQQEAEAAAVQSSTEKIAKLWGDPESEQFKRKNELANRVIRQNNKDDVLMGELKSLGALTSDGSVKAPHLANLLAEIGGKLYAEDSLYAGPNAAVNPFAAGSENLTAQGQIIRTDPERARTLISNAGRDPKEWRL